MNEHEKKAIMFAIEMTRTLGFKGYQHPDHKPDYIDFNDLLNRLRTEK